MGDSVSTEILDAIRQAMADVLVVSDWPRWLPLKSAVKYSGIGKDRLIDLAKSGRVVGFQDLDLSTRPWIFDKESIDRYREVQAGAVKDAVNNILRGLAS